MSDTLLEWMSYAGQGRIDDLPQELAGTGTARHRLIDTLVTLGHAEVPTTSTWRIAVPCLAELPIEPSGRHVAVLCGARTPGVLHRLTAACESSSGTLRSAAAGHVPSIVEVECSSRSDLRRISMHAGIALQDEAAFTLLACLPTISSWPREPRAMIAGRVGEVRRFSRDRLQWQQTSLEEAAKARSGFFRIQREYDWVSLLKLGHAESASIDDRAGRLFVAAKLPAVSWCREDLTLRLPTQLIPPTPVARALALCSGKPPGFDRKDHQLVFEGVNAEMLRLTLAITGLRLK